MNFDQINEFKSSSLHTICTYLFVENAHEKHGDIAFSGTESGQLSYFIVPTFSSLNSSISNNDNFNNKEIPFCNEKRAQDDHGSEVTCLIHSKNKIISPNSDYGLLFSGSRDRTIKVWNINPTRGSRSLVQTLFGHVGAIVAIADSLDGSILTSSAEGNLRVWSPQKGRASMLNPLFDCVFNTTINSSGFLTLAVKPTVNNVVNSIWSCYIGDNSGNIDVFIKKENSNSDDFVTNTLIHKKQWKKIHAKKITHLHVVSERSYLISFSTDKCCKVSHTFSGQVMYSIQNPNKCNYSGALWNSHKSEIELIDELGFFEAFSTIHDSRMHSTQLLTPKSPEQHMVILSGSGKDSMFRFISHYKKDYFFTLNSPSIKVDNKIVLWCNSVVILENKSRNRVSSPPNETDASPIGDIDDSTKEYINNYSESNFNSDSNGVSSPPSSPSKSHIKVAVPVKSSADLLSIDALMKLRSVRIGPRFNTEATRKAIGPTMSRANSSDGRGKSKERGIKSPELPVWNGSNINSVSSNRYKTPLSPQSDSKGNTLENDTSNNDISADCHSYGNNSSNQHIFERIDDNTDNIEEHEKSPFQQTPVSAPHEAQIIAALRNLPSDVRKIIESERQQLLDVIAGRSLSPNPRDNTIDYEQNRSLSHSRERKSRGNSNSSRDNFDKQQSPNKSFTHSHNRSNVSLENDELKKILNPPQRFPVRKHAAKINNPDQENEQRGRSRRVVEGINRQQSSISSCSSVPTKLMKRLSRSSSSQGKVENRNSLSHNAPPVNIRSSVASQSPTSRRSSSNETTRSKLGSVFSTFGGSGGNRDDWILEVDRKRDLRSSSNSRSRSRERSISQQQGRKSIYKDGNIDANNVSEMKNKNESGTFEIKDEPTPTSAAKWLSHKSFFDIYAGKKGVRSISPEKGAGFRLGHSPIDNDNLLADINDVIHAELNHFDEKNRLRRHIPESVEKSPFKTKSYYNNGNDFDIDGDISLINDDDILNDSRSSEYKGNNAVNRDIDLSDDAEWKRLCKWLHSIGMSKYSDAFRSDGAVKLSIMSLLQKNDLNRIGISSNDADYIVNCITEFTDKLGMVTEEALMYSPFGTPNSHKLRGKTSSFSNNLDISIEAPIQQNNNQQSFSPNSYKFARAQALSNSKSTVSNQKNHIQLPNRNNSQIPTPKTNNSKIPTSVPSNNYKSSPIINLGTVPETGLLSDLLLYYYDIGDVHNFFYYWDKKSVVVMSEDAQFFNPEAIKSSAIYNARKAIEFHLCLHFAVYPINHNMGSEIIKERLLIYKKLIEDRFTRDKSTVLIYSREFALYAALAIIPNPKMNPAFSKLFLPQWSSEFRTRFRYFIEIMNIDSGNSPRSQNLIHNQLTDDPSSMSPSHLLGSLRSNIFANEATFGSNPSSPTNQVKEATQQTKNETLIIPTSISTSQQMEDKIETVPVAVTEAGKKAFILAAITKNTKGKKLAFSSVFAAKFANSTSKNPSSIVSETTIKLENKDIVKVEYMDNNSDKKEQDTEELKMEDLESNSKEIFAKDFDIGASKTSPITQNEESVIDISVESKSKGESTNDFDRKSSVSETTQIEILSKVSKGFSLFPDVNSVDTEIVKDLHLEGDSANSTNSDINNDNNDLNNEINNNNIKDDSYNNLEEEIERVDSSNELSIEDKEEIYY
jgi:hypothetical protein